MAFENVGGKFQPLNLGNVVGQAENINNARLQNTRLSQFVDPGSTANQRADFELKGLQERGSLEDMATDAVRGHAILSSGDTEGFQNFAQQRLQKLEQRKLNDPNVNTDHTNRIINIARQNPQEAIRILEADIDGFQKAGILGGLSNAPNISARSEVGGDIVKGVDSAGQPFVSLFDGTVLKGQDALDAIRKDEERKKSLAIATAGGKAQKVADVKLKTEPSIKSATEREVLKERLKWSGEIAKSVKLAEAKGRGEGEIFTKLAKAKAAMPGIKEVAGELKELAMISTSTIGGRAWDAIVKESGFGATEGGTARAKFIAIIDNQVLPLLKPTFGGSFSIQEGESLKATLGDPNATPEAKMAAIDAYIAQVSRNMDADQAELNTYQDVSEPNTTLKPGMVEDGYRFKGGDPGDQNNWVSVQ